MRRFENMQQKKYKLIFAIFLLFLTAKAYPCDVTDSSGSEKKQGSLLYMIRNQLNNCQTINIVKETIEDLDYPPFLYAGTKLKGNFQTLKLKSSATDGCVVNIMSSQTSEAGDGGSVLAYLKIDGSGKRKGVCVYSDDNKLTGLHVQNSTIAIAIKGDKNSVIEGVNYLNDVGVRINGGTQNFITETSFYENGDGIKLINGGNEDFPFPEGVKIVVTKGGAPIGITGHADAVTKRMELFEADSTTSGMPQGQGKTFVTEFKPKIYSFGMNGLKRFANVIANLKTGTSYTITAFDLLKDSSDPTGSNSNTSEFSSAFDPAADKITGGKSCLTAAWFIYALDGHAANGAWYAWGTDADISPWNMDSDGDGCTNIEEDPTQTCDSTKWTSNPADKSSCIGACCYKDKEPTPFSPVIPNIYEPVDGYVPAFPPDICLYYIDKDCDGINDVDDNCAFAANPDQTNTDCDLFGDVCDPDVDNDGLNADEELEAGTDPLKSDSDGDDYCDGTGWGGSCGTQTQCIPMDNCPNKNNNQNDSDDDGIGDACDDESNDACSTLDSDSDGNNDLIDNCPMVANNLQNDEDFDGNGDACDFYDNNTGIEYAAGDLKSDDPNDMDGDGLTDGEDEDEDGDGLTGTAEKCAGVWDPKQKDSDFDKVPDSCDDNDDGDKLSDADESKNYLLRWWYPEKSVDVPRAECGLPVAPDESGGVPPLNDNGVNLASPNNIERMEGSGGSWSNTSGCNGNISGAEASFSLHNFAQLIFFALPALVIFGKRKTSRM